MIVAKIIGGLGNQLFQYAAGTAAAQQAKAGLRLDIADFEKYPLRKVELHKFKIPFTVADEGELRGFRPSPSRIKQAIRELRGAPKHVKEKKDYCFDPRVLALSGDAYLEGYWQSWRYLSGIEARIRSELVPKRAPEGRNLELIAELKSSSSAMVHVRRGDYVTNAHTAGFHGSCPIEYYQAAADRLLAVEPSSRFFVFSDDPSWCKSNLKLPGPTRFVDHNSPEAPEEDLRLMASCRHHIIANSSLSWWGAWLAKAPGQLVFAPKRWLADPRSVAPDLIPSEWERL